MNCRWRNTWRVHLVEIALASGNGVPVVAAQQHGDDLVADGNQNVVIKQPADGDDDRNQQKQRRIETYCTLGNISHEIQRSGFRQRTEIKLTAIRNPETVKNTSTP